RHHEIWDAMTRELLGLLAATPEDERVAAFEARHLEALAREADHELVDVFLRRMSCASSMMLADEDAARLAPGALEHRGRNQPVVEHDIRLLQQLQRAQREEVGVAGTGADEIHLTERTAAGRGRGGELRNQQLRF